MYDPESHIEALNPHLRTMSLTNRRSRLYGESRATILRCPTPRPVLAPMTGDTERPVMPGIRAIGVALRTPALPGVPVVVRPLGRRILAHLAHVRPGRPPDTPNTRMSAHIGDLITPPCGIPGAIQTDIRRITRIHTPMIAIRGECMKNPTG